jgi:hypothetical protein
MPLNAARVRMLDVPAVVTGSRLDALFIGVRVRTAVYANLPRLQPAAPRNPRVPYAVRVEFVLREAGRVGDRRVRAVNLGLRHLAVAVQNSSSVAAPVN